MTCGNATTPPRSPGGSTTGSATGTRGNHPGYALGCWLRDYKEQVFLFTRNFAVGWTNNVCERGAKAAKRHQAVSGYWHSLATLARWCRLRSYLDSAAAHGITALDAIRAPSPESPGYRHSPPSADANSRHPVNGHLPSPHGVACHSAPMHPSTLPVPCR